MHWRIWRRRNRRVVGAALAVLGVTAWAIAGMPHLTPDHRRDVSIGHFEERSLAVITGGASVAGAVILFATAV